MKEKTNSDKIYGMYKEEETKNKELIDKVNSFQRFYEFKEFRDVVTRCYNSEINYIRFCNNNNIKFDDPDVLPIYEAYHVYVYRMYEKASYELSRYLEERNMIFLGKELTLKEKIKRILSISNTREFYLPIQNHVDNYERIADEIIEIDVKRDIKDIIATYINNIFDSFKNFTGNEEQADYMFKTFMNQARPALTEALVKLKLYDGIKTIDEEVIKLTTKNKEDKSRSRIKK